MGDAYKRAYIEVFATAAKDPNDMGLCVNGNFQTLEDVRLAEALAKDVEL
jgi:hypothetical protein